MPTYPTWDYVPVLHNFVYTASIAWPGQQYDQLDWIVGITEVEAWLTQYAGAKYQRWAWNMGTESYHHISVAFKYDKHRTLFLLNYA
jgi:hypothetical protein